MPIDQPTPSPTSDARWGSDYIAEMMRALGIEYLALTPGASYRGLHDSLVNHLGNKDPQMLLALHEESAVAMAQDRKSTRLNSSHVSESRMPSSA